MALTASPLMAVETERDWSYDQLPELARNFSVCLGRASAALEHAHLVGAQSENEMMRWQSFNSLVEATVPAQPRSLSNALMSLRVKSKHALLRLLNQGNFHGDPRRSSKARIDAQVRLQQCDEMIF